MKFVSAITALVAAMAVGSEAAKPSVRELSQRAKNGQLDKATLMSNAKPHSEAAKRRKLDGSVITGYHSIQFESCFSMTTSYDDLFSGDDEMALAMSLFSSGDMLALKSYAIFKLCYGGDCSATDGSLEYVVDLNTYLMSLINYLPTQMEGFQEACEENAATCQAQLYGYGYNYGGRKLTERYLENQVIRELDCSLCDSYGFLTDDDADNNEEFEKASEWVSEISECKETGIQYQGGYSGQYGQYYQDDGDGQELFAGIICNADGSGVEIGMFYDEDCSLYLPNEAYSDYQSYYDASYQEMTKDVVEFTFSSNVFSCKEVEYVYTTQDMSNYNGEYNQNNNNNDDDDKVAEWCEELAGGDVAPVDMATCGVYQYYGGNYDGGEWAEYYENYQQQKENQADQYEYQYTYDWYRFEIDEEDALDMSAVCKTVKSEDGEIHTFYNANNGNMYTYEGSTSEAVDEFLDATEAKTGLSGGAKFGIVALVGLVLGAVVALYMKFQASSKDDKNVGLIDPETVETTGGEVA